MIRDPLGCLRFDTVDQTLAINHLYDLMGVYYNFFQPVLRDTEKILPPANGVRSHIQCRYDPARAPLDRLCDTQALSQTQKDQLPILQDQINPRLLRQAIYDRGEHIFNLPPAQPGVIEDIHPTLSG